MIPSVLNVEAQPLTNKIRLKLCDITIVVKDVKQIRSLFFHAAYRFRFWHHLVECSYWRLNETHAYVELHQSMLFQVTLYVSSWCWGNRYLPKSAESFRNVVSLFWAQNSLNSHSWHGCWRCLKDRPTSWLTRSVFDNPMCSSKLTKARCTFTFPATKGSVIFFWQFLGVKQKAHANICKGL